MRPVQMGVEGLVHATGVALSDLAPDGTARVVNETWTAHATRGSIAAGTRVRVVRVRGVNLVVEPEKELAGHPAQGQSGSEGEKE